MDHLWSPWRLEYITADKGRDRGKGEGERRERGEHAERPCVFCAAPQAPDPLVVFQGSLAYVVLNLYPYNNGHLMVVPYRHESTLAGLTRDEMNEVGLLTQRSELVLREAYKLQGINVGVNLGAAAGAGIEEHVHVHLVPRWHGDTNFMTAVGQTRVLPEAIRDTAARLRPIFDRLAAAR